MSGGVSLALAAHLLGAASGPVPQTGLPTAVALQLTSEVAAPEGALEALVHGLTEAGETAVAANFPVDPACPGKPSCIEALLERVGAARALFLVLVGLGADVQIAATRVDEDGLLEDLDPVSVERVELTARLRALGRAWARPPPSEPPSVEVPRPGAALPDARPDAAPDAAPDAGPSGGPEGIDVAPALEGAPSRGPGPAVWVAGGVAVATLAAGASLGIVALDTRSGLSDQGCHLRACDPARVDALEAQALAADVLLTTAAVSAIVTGVLWWLDGEDAR